MAAEVRIIVNFAQTGIDPAKVEREVKGIGNAAEQSSGGFSILAGAAATALGSIAANAAMAAGAMAASFVGESVNLASQFEANMNAFGAAVGGSLDSAGLELSQFQDLFIELGARLPISTLEAQEAALALAKGGLDPASIAAGGLESSLLFASAAQMGLAEAAELTMKQLGTFIPLTASAAEKTAFMAESQDLLVKAANASTLDVETLGNAMLAAGGQAKAVGLDYEELVTTMGLISAGFPSAAEAGTSFKNFLVRLLPTTDTATKAMMELGLVTANGDNLFYDSTGTFVGMEQAITLLGEATRDLSDEQRTLAFQAIFGNDAMGAAIAIADAGIDGYLGFAESMETTNGVMEQSVALQQGMEFAMGELEGAIEAAQITLGLKFLPALEYLTQIATAVVNALMGDADAFAALQQYAADAVAFLTANGPGFAEQMRQFIIAGTQFVITELGNFLMGIVTWIASNEITIITEMMRWTQALSGWIGDAAGQASVNLQGFLANLGSFIQEYTPTLVLLMQGWGMTLVQFIVDAIPPLLENLGIWLTSLGDFLVENLPILVEGFATWAVQMYEWIIAALPGLTESLLEFLDVLFVWLIDNLPGIVAQLVEWTGAFFGWVLDALPDLLINLGELLATILVWLMEKKVELAGVIETEWIPAITEWLKKAVPEMLLAVAAFFAELIAKIAAQAGIIKAEGDIVGSQIIDGIAAGIAAGTGRLIDAARQMASDVYATVTEFFDMRSPSRLMKMEVGMNITSGIAEGIQQGTPSLVNTLQSSMRDVVSNAITDTAAIAPDIAASLGRRPLQRGSPELPGAAMPAPAVPSAPANVTEMIGRLIADQRTQNITANFERGGESGQAAATMINALARGLR